MFKQIFGKKREQIPIVDCLEGGQPMYAPEGKLLAWLRSAFNSSPGKWSVRVKARDPHNWGNRENMLYDTEIISADSIMGLIEELLIKANHMNTGIMYLNTPEGDTIYARDTHSGGFSVDKYILGDE